MKRLFFFIILSVTSINIFAELVILKGKVTDSKSGNGIAYTNIGIEGTLYGTASDAEGSFELKIPDGYENSSIYFSAVGYSNKLFGVSDFAGKDYVVVELEEQTYGIEGINVAAQSKVLFRIIRTASEKIKENYPAGPFGMKFYYQEKEGDKQREAVIQLSDQTGYRSPSILNAFKSRNYQLTEAKRNFEVLSFRQGTTGFDDLLEADIARMGNMILSKNLINDYDLELEKSTVFNGDSIWVIDYRTDKTDLVHTGNYDAQKFHGKIYISKSDYGIVRNEIMVESDKQNPQGRSLAIGKSGNANVVDNITVGYKKINGEYILSFVTLDKQYVNAEGQKKSMKQNAVVLDVQKNGFPQFTSRDYFDDAEFNSSFWESFVSPLK